HSSDGASHLAAALSSRGSRIALPLSHCVMFLFYCSVPLRHLRSFPTRRSSDPHQRAFIPWLELRRRLVRAERRGQVVHAVVRIRSEEHTSELQSPYDLVCRPLLEKKKGTMFPSISIFAKSDSCSADGSISFLLL